MLSGVLSWMFRPQCAACGIAVAAPLCTACRETLVEAEPPPTIPAPLAELVAPWQFGGALASAIKRLKFTGANHVARAVAPLWAPILAAAATDPDVVVVPVPLHWRRRMRRGYDQTWLLADHACRAAQIAPPRALLRRLRAAPAQSTLPAAQRAANVAGAFALRGTPVLVDRTIVLVDDVVTTGATLASTAAPLMAAGAARVIAVALARTP